MAIRLLQVLRPMSIETHLIVSSMANTTIAQETDWKIEDVLDLFKRDIDAQLIGDAKNIKKHRDWIAHRNPRRPSPGAVTPAFAYKILSEALAHIGRL